MSEKSWPVALYALLGSLISLFLFGALPWMGSVCGTSTIDAGKPIVDGAGGCIEFWLNRYQSFISAILSLVVATAAAALVWRQIESAQEANRISRFAQSVSQFDVVYRRLEAIRALRKYYKIAQHASHEMSFIIEMISSEKLSGIYRAGKGRKMEEYLELIYNAVEDHKGSLSAGFEAVEHISRLEVAVIVAISTKNYFIDQFGREIFPDMRHRLVDAFNQASADLMSAANFFGSWIAEEEAKMLSVLKKIDQNLVR